MTTKTSLAEIQLNILLTHVHERSTSLSSYLHGESHWLRVARVGLELAKAHPDSDLTTIFLFSLLHDSQRLSDGLDPQHGTRASHFIQQLQQEQIIALADDQIKMLTYACNEHNNGHLSDDPTIGICWDADRLNLWRVGIKPHRKYLSTDSAKSIDMQCKSLLWQRKRFTWDKLYSDFVALEHQQNTI